MNNIPWVDKYRPKRINHLVNQEEIVKVLQTVIKTGNLPNLILYGPPGTGKTSAILALAYELFGPKLIEERVLELNASDERGIDVVRDKIIKFAKESISTPDPDFPSPPYKIIILDEADAITLDAQSALRKIIESSSRITRFCFTCNYIEKIIPPIISRCVKFRFKPLTTNDMSYRLKLIAEFENIKINDNCLDIISNMSQGDGRRAIMILQNCKYILKLKNKITEDDCYDLTGAANNTELQYIWSVIEEKNISLIDDLVKYILKNSININDILLYINNKILTLKIKDSIKSKLLQEILNIDAKLLDKGDEYLNILYLLSLITLEI